MYVDAQDGQRYNSQLVAGINQTINQSFLLAPKS